jgi:hypothetical protein
MVQNFGSNKIHFSFLNAKIIGYTLCHPQLTKYCRPNMDKNQNRNPSVAFSPILTLWTLQTAVTWSFMVRFEKFLQFGTE